MPDTGYGIWDMAELMSILEIRRSHTIRFIENDGINLTTN